MNSPKQEFVQKELKRLRDHKIPYDFKRCGSKDYAVVLLTNEKYLMVDPYCRTVMYQNKSYKYKYLENWLKKNKLEVRRIK